MFIFSTPVVHGRDTTPLSDGILLILKVTNTKRFFIREGFLLCFLLLILRYLRNKLTVNAMASLHVVSSSALIFRCIVVNSADSMLTLRIISISADA